MMSPITIAIAGSTAHTAQCAEAILNDPRFQITSIFTPAPKPVGRKKTVTPNPLHMFAQQHTIPTILIEEKINEQVKQYVETLTQPDLLLVVDFGYFLPNWLLSWPTLAPINIHPSDLPKFRGSSPGQFVLLFGETQSAVTLIRMDNKLDHGPIITKLSFAISPTWTTKEYYSHAFDLIAKELPTLLAEFVHNPTQGTTQPDGSPTPLARQQKRDDGYIPLAHVQQAMGIRATPTTPIPLLDGYALTPNAEQLYNMWRALTPWPGVWTVVNTKEGNKRVKLVECSFTNNHLIIRTIQVEGKNPKPFQKGVFSKEE
ncbi:hypothetical protein C5B42_03655 [Candidatus Cerribacteria bacterium 'Amazon FNV 2010 28 9']|uniref:Uncharacterized protein n=1 Tax=Candidatus Cerribacteria bacterium 'Amazon FNV 2010 28 9' TaxID=2081795 RepID=A0A317JPJ7_9BACT|nr:MAG: hypothetical protein C5B42_03655 [Candidatus Cerribacteria bacterium 'Amazon FNV 2010 28 9']